MALWKITDADGKVVGFYDAESNDDAIRKFRVETLLTEEETEFHDAWECSDAEMAALV
jgi:hypothetical protein